MIWIPAIRATSSAQAPAALTTTGDSNAPAVDSTCQSPSRRPRLRTSAPQRKRAAAPFEGAEVSAVQAMDIDVQRFGLVKRARDIGRPQQRKQRECLRGVDVFDRSAKPGDSSRLGVESIHLVRARDDQHTARR
jgi:hypothetical protein